jgi:glucose/arabinose dehydrogenase/PKD repeat protein
VHVRGWPTLDDDGLNAEASIPPDRPAPALSAQQMQPSRASHMAVQHDGSAGKALDRSPNQRRADPAEWRSQTDVLHRRKGRALLRRYALSLWLLGGFACSDGTDRVADPDGSLSHDESADASLVEVGVANVDAASGRHPVTNMQRGFVERIVFTDLAYPTALRFARDGRVFVAEKTGVIKAFESPGDTTSTVVADLRRQTHAGGDRGLLDIELDPGFPERPYLYALYTLDGRPGESVAAGTVPRYHDGCPDEWQAGCVVAGRLVRLTVAGDQMENEQSETVVVENWLQQYMSHSVGSLAFGPDGFLYASAGDGASFDKVDYGNIGGNALGEPPDRSSTGQKPPGAMGGALRSQIVTPPPGPVPFATSFAGKIIRIDPHAPGHLVDPHDVPRPPPVVAAGLRNPFRVAFRPGTKELWIGDVGWTTSEELNRIADVSAARVTNFGWPCFEGREPQSGYEAAGLDICSKLYSHASEHVPPVLSYRHWTELAPGDGCDIQNGSALSGLAFYDRGAYPAEYEGALFFSDYARGCIWVLPRGALASPGPQAVKAFWAGAAQPVQLQIGPEGDLYYVDLGGSIRRIEHGAGNHPPLAKIQASPRVGPLPLTVTFDAKDSTDPDPNQALTHDWDLDGDGLFDDGHGRRVNYTYRRGKPVLVRLKVTDSKGASATAQETVWPGHALPSVRIEQPEPWAWKVGDRISLSGAAEDGDGGVFPESALTWSVILKHCPDACHEHPMLTVTGQAKLSFQAPDHEYPMHLVVVLSAVNEDGLKGTASTVLKPRTAVVTLDSRPAGLQLAWNGELERTPFSRAVIVGSTNSVSAPSQVSGTVAHPFYRWSDGGAQSHSLVVRRDQATYEALFASLPLTRLERRAREIIVHGPGIAGDGPDGREVIRDGVRPDPLTAGPVEQYVTRHLAPPIGADAYVGYRFRDVYTFARLVFQEGALLPDGGFFDSLSVEVRRNGRWVPVRGLRSRPGYAGSNGASWETFVFDFEPTAGNGIRLVGRPGGVARFLSVAELEVWGTRRQP